MDFFSRNGRWIVAHLALVLLAGCSASRAAKPAAFTSSSASAPPAAPQASGPAQGLVASMRQGVATAGGPGREILVCLQGIRNQSHASAGEFEQMRHRLADALGSAGLDQNPPMLFAAEPAGACDFDLTGTAYLVTASGFDQWELYLDMHRAGEAWSVWRLPGALRMLRHPRPGEAELLIPVNP
jgi:hypothetical protein